MERGKFLKNRGSVRKKTEKNLKNAPIQDKLEFKGVFTLFYLFLFIPAPLDFFLCAVKYTAVCLSGNGRSKWKNEVPAVFSSKRGNFSMDKFYYHGESGQKNGPVNARQLRTLAKTGQILRETIIETEEGKKCPARKVQGLVFGTESLVPENEPSTGGTAKIILPPDDKKSGDTGAHASTKSHDAPPIQKSPADLTLDELRKRRQRQTDLAQNQAESVFETPDSLAENGSKWSLFGPRTLESTLQTLNVSAGIFLILVFVVLFGGIIACFLAQCRLCCAAGTVLAIFCLLILRTVFLFFVGIGAALRESNAQILDEIRTKR